MSFFNGLLFQVADLSASFRWEPHESFDRAVMRVLRRLPATRQAQVLGSPSRSIRVVSMLMTRLDPTHPLGAHHGGGPPSRVHLTYTWNPDMTSVLIRKDHILGGWWSKIEVIQVLGIYIYLIYIYMYI